MKPSAWIPIFSSLLLAAVVASWLWFGANEDPFLDTPLSEPQEKQGPAQVTFSRDIAPIVFQNCSPCHHPNGSAPFSILDYEHARNRASQIALVTRTGYMPPWPPDPGPVQFKGERRLTPQQIELIQKWAELGAPQGDSSDLPEVPSFQERWQLGTPDLILRVAEPFTLAPADSDVFRNFVIPVPGQPTRFVKALEMRPGNKKIVHHANILIDRSGAARRLDRKEAGPGFAGMELELESQEFEPQTHFLFWKPGSVAQYEPPGMSWRLDKGTDLVINMHLQPSGKPETIQPEIGIYFTREPPTRFPMLIQLERDGELDIPPGDSDFSVMDHFELPVDVEVLAVYPHCHYLGKSVEGYAVLPDGSRKRLIRIRQWDFNWQAVYPYEEPVFLPKGSVIRMRFTYDNSAENVFNPHHPPRRVTAGNRSSDEMSHLWLQVLPKEKEGLKTIQAALMERRLEKYPGDFFALFNLGAIYQSRGKLRDAARLYLTALRARPEDAVVRNNLGATYLALGRRQEAIRQFEESIRLDPGYANPHFNLASLLLESGRLQEAALHFESVLAGTPDDPASLERLGRIRAEQGSFDEAAHLLERAIAADSSRVEPYANLAGVYAVLNQLPKSEELLRKALRLEPRNADLHNDLGSSLAAQGKISEAARHFRRALELAPDHSPARSNLQKAMAELAKAPSGRK